VVHVAESDVQQVRAVIDEMVGALNAGDVGRIRSLLSERPDAVHIGTDASEWETSKEFVDAVAAAGTDSGIQAVVDDLSVHVLGDVAWAEGRGRFTNPDGAQRPVRVTGVLVREDGGWKVAQQHSSIGVPNADIFR
jgi:uncharacterized protein (TIGR02246 family)